MAVRSMLAAARRFTGRARGTAAAATLLVAAPCMPALQSQRPRCCLPFFPGPQARKQNPKAFIFSSKGKAKLQQARTAEKEQRRMHGAHGPPARRWGAAQSHVARRLLQPTCLPCAVPRAERRTTTSRCWTAPRTALPCSADDQPCRRGAAAIHSAGTRPARGERRRAPAAAPRARASHACAALSGAGGARWLSAAATCGVLSARGAVCACPLRAPPTPPHFAHPCPQPPGGQNHPHQGADQALHAAGRAGHQGTHHAHRRQGPQVGARSACGVHHHAETPAPLPAPHAPCTPRFAAAAPPPSPAAARRADQLPLAGHCPMPCRLTFIECPQDLSAMIDAGGQAGCCPPTACRRVCALPDAGPACWELPAAASRLAFARHPLHPGSAGHANLTSCCCRPGAGRPAHQGRAAASSCSAKRRLAGRPPYPQPSTPTWCCC